MWGRGGRPGWCHPHAETGREAGTPWQRWAFLRAAQDAGAGRGKPAGRLTDLVDHNGPGNEGTERGCVSEWLSGGEVDLQEVPVMASCKSLHTYYWLYRSFSVSAISPLLYRATLLAAPTSSVKRRQLSQVFPVFGIKGFDLPEETCKLAVPTQGDCSRHQQHNQGDVIS